LLRPTPKEVSSLISGVPADVYRYYLCLLVLVIVMVITSNLMRSRTGRSIVAVRDQEVAASTVGVDVARVKVLTFALSGAFAGVAGSLSVMIDRSADASNPLIYFQRSIEFLIAVVIGGAATISGPLLGAMLLVFIRKRTEDTEALAPALLGGALILVVYVLPEGVVGGYRRIVGIVRSRMGSSGPPATESPSPDSTPDPPPEPSPSPS
jgi:branched-chain amino acid transport system permease protein